MESSAPVLPEHHAYGPHRLQNAAVWKLDDEKDGTNGYWIIFIHGGAWRDPRIEAATSFQPTVDHLLHKPPYSTAPDPAPASSSSSSSPPPAGIAGLASLSYRLSPHPDFPQDPSSTPSSEYRGARHPDHIQDVRSGLAMLQRKYMFGSRYVVVGHSCGATLALQVLMGVAAAASREAGRERGDDRSAESPAAVIGIEGIYDFRGLVERFGPGYTPIFEVPFGRDRKAWDEASPALFNGWKGHAERIVLAWSSEDELVDGMELKTMADALCKAGVQCRKYMDLKGTHDEIWESGQEVARLCVETLQSLS